MNLPINKTIDHTLLKADATEKQISLLCQEAKKYQFASVCVNSFFVPQCVEELKGTDVKVCTVVGFPLGASTLETKRYEAMKAMSDGASEIDMVIHLSALKSENWNYVQDDITSLVKIVHNQNNVLKVILETCLLSEDEIRKACEICLLAQVDYIKTSTGFSTHGATLEVVKLIKSIATDKAKIKASGGIKDFETAQKMIAAGADRLGTSSGVNIMEKSIGSSSY